MKSEKTNYNQIEIENMLVQMAYPENTNNTLEDCILNILKRKMKGK